MLLLAIFCGVILPIPLGFLIGRIQEKFGFVAALIVALLLSAMVLITFATIYTYQLNLK